MTKNLKILLIALFSIIVIGGLGALGWFLYDDYLAANETTDAPPSAITETKPADPDQDELDKIEKDIKTSDDLNISDLDNTTELDKTDLSGI
jgi:hypothetical protein